MSDATIDDTLRDTYASLRGSFESDFTAPPDPAPIDPVDPETPTDPADPVDPEPQDPTDPEDPQDDPADPADPANAPESSTFRPPWKKAALADWEKLPESARKEIERRENDFHKGIEQYKAGAQASQDWERAVQPYMATIQGFGVTPQIAAQHLFSVDHQLRYSAVPQKIGMLAKIAGDYGVDIPTLMQGLQQMSGQQQWQQENPLDPRVQQLQARVEHMQQQQFQTQHQAATAENSAIDAEIAAFAMDPDREHFQLLQPRMTQLLQAGLVKSLEDAYDTAFMQDPQTRPLWEAQQRQRWEEERKAKVLKAKQAGANNVRPNGRASVTKVNANETMEQTLERVAREQGLIN